VPDATRTELEAELEKLLIEEEELSLKRRKLHERIDSRTRSCSMKRSGCRKLGGSCTKESTCSALASNSARQERNAAGVAAIRSFPQAREAAVVKG
jgi:hypothetical protein